MNIKDKGKKTGINKSQLNKTSLKVSKNKQNKWVWFSLAVVSFTTFAIYFKALKFDFLLWDDELYITKNSLITVLNWTNIKLIFTEFYALNYHPFTILIYAIEYKFAGISPLLYHLNNIILHIINSILVFVLIRKISPKNVAVALITTAFFAVHPMHVESVAWASETKDVLYSFFFLLSLIIYTNYLKSEKPKFLIEAGIFFVLSCLSKSAAVILPLILLLFDYYSNRKYNWKMFVEKIPFFAISLLFGVLAMNSQKEAIPIISKISPSDHIFVVSNSFIRYIIKAFLPVHLSAIYPYPVQLGSTLPAKYYLSIFCVGLVLFFVWYSRRWGKDVVFGFVFFIVTIILVLQFVSVGNAAMAERYTYIPYIGIFFIVGKLYEYLSSRTNIYYKNWLLIVLVLSCIIFTFATSVRIEKWQNDEILFSDVIKKYPLNPIAYNNRGCYYLKITQDDSPDKTAKREMYFVKSFQDFNKVIEIDKNYIHIYHNRGLSRYFLKDHANAIKDYDTEILNNPEDAGVYFDRGNAKNEFKDYVGAIKDFDKAIELNLKTGDVYFNRGNVKKELKDYSGAIKDFDKAVELNPKLLKAYNNRSLLKCILKDYEGTIADYNKMIELNPKDTITIKNRKIVKSLLINPRNSK